MLRLLRRSFPVAALLLGGCALSDGINQYGDHSPPPEFGRPGWVRAVAGAGAWVGGIIGGVASVVMLPVTYPLSLLAEDGLESSQSEFLLFPAMSVAALGHCGFGIPADVIDWGFRRAWVGSSEPNTGYAMIPMADPQVPQARAASAEGATAPEDPPR